MRASFPTPNHLFGKLDDAAGFTPPGPYVMCNLLFVSTSSDENLIELSTVLYRFEPIDFDKDAAFANLLAYPNPYFLSGRYGGCSCHYRHTVGFAGQPEFAAPEGWLPEDDDDVESTAAIYSVFERIVGEGHRLDVLNSWSGEDLEDIVSLSVDLAHVSRERFRFFSGHRFDFI